MSYIWHNVYVCNISSQADVNHGVCLIVKIGGRSAFSHGAIGKLEIGVSRMASQRHHRRARSAMLIKLSYRLLLLSSARARDLLWQYSIEGEINRMGGMAVMEIEAGRYMRRGAGYRG